MPKEKPRRHREEAITTIAKKKLDELGLKKLDVLDFIKLLLNPPVPAFEKSGEAEVGRALRANQLGQQALEQPGFERQALSTLPAQAQVSPWEPENLPLGGRSIQPSIQHGVVPDTETQRNLEILRQIRMGER